MVVLLDCCSISFQVITQLNLLPLNDETVDVKLASFRNYDDEVNSFCNSVSGFT